MFATGDAHILWSRLIGALRLTFSSSHSKLSKVLLQWQLLELLPRKVRLFLKMLISTRKFLGKGKHKNQKKGRKFGGRSTSALEWLTQLSGEEKEDTEIPLFIEAIIAKNLLTMYCAERKLAKTGTKLEQVQRLMKHGWTLGTDEALQEDYARLQPIHGTSKDDEKDESTQTDQEGHPEEEKGEKDKDQAIKAKTILRAPPRPTEDKEDIDAPRPNAPRPGGTGTVPAPNYPPQGAPDLGYGQFQNWIDEGIRSRPPPPAYPYGRESTEYPPPRRVEDSLFERLGPILDRLALSIDLQARSIDLQAKATKLAIDTREEDKEVALPGTLSAKIKKALIAGEYVNIMALWDKDVAKARTGYAGQRATTRPPKAAEECYWDDWLLAMLSLSQKYFDSRQDNISKQVIKLITGAAQGTAKHTRASIMAACEVLRQDCTYPSCNWSLDVLLLHGRSRILLEQLTDGSSGLKRKFTTFKSAGQPKPFNGKSRPPTNGPCKWWLSGKECKFGHKLRLQRQSRTTLPPAPYHQGSRG